MEDKTQNNNTSLLYKNQDPFFIDYYEYRREAIKAKANILIDNSNYRKEAILTINSLIDFTVGYVNNFKDKKETIKELMAEYKDPEFSQFTEKFNNLWEELAQDHINYEILPKPQMQEDKDLEEYWKSENHKAVRELKKVTTDIFKFA